MSKVIATVKGLIQSVLEMKVSINIPSQNRNVNPMVAYVLVLFGAVGIIRAASEVY